MYVCTHVITNGNRGTCVPGGRTHKITSAHSLKKEGVVGGQEYCPEEVTRQCCITKMAVPRSIKRASLLVRKCVGGVVVTTRYEIHSCTDTTR